MATPRPSFGLTLPNRGVLFGATTPAEMLELAETAEASGAFDAVWVGDSVMAKPRLEAVTLLTAVAARTRRVKLGPACFASFPLRHPVLLAYQWASLDLISGGRTIMVACMGGGSPEAGGDFFKEFQTMGVPIAERAARMEEGIQVLRRLWNEDHVTLRGRFYQLDEVTIEPKPAQRPLPIWIANNPQVFNVGEQTLSRAAQRVARFADGWMTTMVTPAGFREAWRRVRDALRAEGRDADTVPTCLYFNVHINDDRTRAYEESKKFIDKYYMTDFPKATVDMWIAHGDVKSCAEHINQFIDAGVQHFTLRLTSWDQKAQLRRVIDELMPHLHRSGGGAPQGAS
jgi:alkanesulfonate monooxygenase SsuD/methylene tetrahydromethanopterin reductase-like flavin-dependent oxidoreductase (luciferase family)